MSAPDYIPIPRVGTKCPYSGLCRSTIYNLIDGTKANGYRIVVESTSVRIGGRKRGARRVNYASLMRYMRAGVVSPEKVLLRRAWNEMKASRRRGIMPPAPAELLSRNPDDLPEDAVIVGEDCV